MASSKPSRSRRLLVLALGLVALLALDFLLLTGDVQRLIWTNVSRVALLKLQVAPDETERQQFLAITSRSYTELRSISANPDAYLLAQLEFAPDISCPYPESSVDRGTFYLSDSDLRELARWMETQSVIPICLSQGRLDHAALFFDLASAQYPGLTRVYEQLPSEMASGFVSRAYEQYAEGNTEQAERNWLRARAYLNDSPPGVFEEVAEKQSAQYRAAQQHLLQTDLSSVTSGMEKDTTTLRLFLAQSYNSDSKFALALDTISPAIDSRSVDTRVWQQYGQALVGLQRISEAESALREAVRLAPEDLQALNRLGVFLLSTGRSTEAVSLFHRALASEGGDKAYWVWEHLGDAMLAEGNIGGAREAYKMAVEIAPAGTQASAQNKLSELK